VNRLERWNAKVERALVTEMLTLIWIGAVVTLVIMLGIVGVF
jgi:hypothetical protein